VNKWANDVKPAEAPMVMGGMCQSAMSAKGWLAIANHA